MGSCRLVRSSVDGAAAENAEVLDPGSYFGELEVICGCENFSTAECTSDGTVLMRISVDDFPKFLAATSIPAAEFRLRAMREHADVLDVIRHPVGVVLFRYFAVHSGIFGAYGGPVSGMANAIVIAIMNAIYGKVPHIQL